MRPQVQDHVVLTESQRQRDNYIPKCPGQQVPLAQSDMASSGQALIWHMYWHTSWYTMAKEEFR